MRLLPTSGRVSCRSKCQAELLWNCHRNLCRCCAMRSHSSMCARCTIDYGTLSALRLVPVLLTSILSCCPLTSTFCNASQSCIFASCPSAHMNLYFCRPNPHNRNSRNWQNQHALVYVWKLSKTGSDIVLELFGMDPGRWLIKG